MGFFVESLRKSSSSSSSLAWDTCGSEPWRPPYISLTEVYFLGFSWRSKEEGTETHTKRAVVSIVGRPEVAVALLKFVEDSH